MYKMSLKYQLYLFTLLYLLFVQQNFSSAAVIIKRDTDDESYMSDDSNRKCDSHVACAWSVYTPFTRRVEYHINNTCLCESWQTCEMAEDDFSISAFVYRCHPT